MYSVLHTVLYDRTAVVQHSGYSQAPELDLHKCTCPCTVQLADSPNLPSTVRLCRSLRFKRNRLGVGAVRLGGPSLLTNEPAGAPPRRRGRYGMVAPVPPPGTCLRHTTPRSPAANSRARRGAECSSHGTARHPSAG